MFVTYQDSQGYLWFGTEDSLNKYNGYNFDVYKFDPTDSASISNNIVRCIQEDKDGDLWIGTDNGLNRYSRHNGSFTRFLHDPSDARSLVTILFPVSSRTKRASLDRHRQRTERPGSRYRKLHHLPQHCR